MNTLLLCGYRPEHPLGLESEASGQILLDAKIEKLQDIGLTPIVVLAGPWADENLRQSRLLENCELVYDVNHQEANLFTNLRSGLMATDEACFVIPVEVPVPPEAQWKQLKSDLLQAGFLTNHHVFQLAMEQGAPWQYGFPLLVSSVGRRTILNLESPKGITDPRLRYYFTRPALATAANPL